VSFYNWFSWFPSSQNTQNLLFDNLLVTGLAIFLLIPRKYQYKNVKSARLIFFLIIASALLPFNLLVHFNIIPEHIAILNGFYWEILGIVFFIYILLLMDGVNRQYKIRRTKEEILALFRCSECGHQNRIRSRFCSKCGSKIKV
jgi:hypothetical protein